MEFNEMQEQLLAYFYKNYEIREKKFFRKFDDLHEWGIDIAKSLPSIFSFEHIFCSDMLKHWAYKENMTSREYELAFKPFKLTTQWNVEMASDLRIQYGVENAEEQVISMLANEIAKEIDAEYLKELKKKTKTIDEFISLVKCIGYEPSVTVFDTMTMKPRKGFVAMNYNDIKNERSINPHWQDWIRPSEQVNKA